MSALSGQQKTYTMSQSLSKLYTHVIFHVKSNGVLIRETDQQALNAYVASILHVVDSIPIIVNGVSDHLHILTILSKNVALARMVEDVKRNSSRWIKTLEPYYRNFSWQGGYAGFSVSAALQCKTKEYIANQAEHHKKMSFKDEYLLFLKEYDVEYNEQFLWND